MTQINFEGLVNARDVGGLSTSRGRVRSGRLFRSETPQLMTDDDVGRALDEFGIRRVIDLRDNGAGGSGPIGADGRGVCLDYFGLSGGIESGADLSPDGFLPGQLDWAAPALGTFLQLLLDAPGPTLVHCHTGKDRTGFVVAMLLSLLGVDNEHIVADYAVTSVRFDEMLTNLRAAGMPVKDNAPPFALHRPSTHGIRAMLDKLHAEWGDSRSYALSEGIGEQLIIDVVDLMTEPAAAPTIAQ